MKLKINKSKLKINSGQAAKKSGYSRIVDRISGKESYVNRLGSNYYPRFHLYISEDDNFVYFNLHLDQKKASYAGSSAHSGEYGGETVEKELKRILEVLKKYKI